MQRPPKTAAEALKQSRPFRNPRQEANVSLLLTTEAVRQRFAAFLAGPGKDQVTMQQYNVLRILRGAGKEGLPTLTIADRMIEKTPGITGMIDRLLAKGLVEREHCVQDRRQILVRISTAGLEVLAGMDGEVNSLNETVLSCLDDREVRQLIDLLNRVRIHNS
jgi:MarR family transcriptional regulator, organic hydroperoxide resistance regulator